MNEKITIFNIIGIIGSASMFMGFITLFIIEISKKEKRRIYIFLYIIFMIYIVWFLFPYQEYSLCSSLARLLVGIGVLFVSILKLKNL